MVIEIESKIIYADVHWYMMNIYAVVIMLFAGEVPSYYCKTNEWQLYIERLNIYFRLNHFTDNDGEKKRAILLTTVCPEIYENIRNLCAPTLPANVPYTKLMHLLHRQYSQPIGSETVFGRRLSFYNAMQETGESILQWYNRILELSGYCEFGDACTDVMLDRFVSGLKSSGVADSVQTMSIDTKLYKLIDIAIDLENRG